MQQLILHNQKILAQYYTLEHQCSYSYPLLVSPKLIIHHPKIMYIGQETNTWFKELTNHMSSTTLEENYYYFLKNQIPSTLFWKFIMNSFELKRDTLYQNILWCNTLLCGQRSTKGTPIISDELLDLSIQYLLFLYQQFQPETIIIVAGPNNPYYSIIKAFLETIQKEVPYPTKEQICQNTGNVIWTYHPNYLNRTGKIKEVTNQIMTLRKK